MDSGRVVLYILNFSTLRKQVGSFNPLSLELYLKNTYLNVRPLPLNLKCLQFNVKFCSLCVRTCVWCVEVRGMLENYLNFREPKFTTNYFSFSTFHYLSFRH